MKEVEILGRRRVYDGYSKVDEVEVRTEGTEKRVKREIVERGDAVGVLLKLVDEDAFLLVRQLRVPLMRQGEPWLLEIVAGMIDEGESPEEAARREVEEEVGFRIGTLKPLGEMFSSPGTLSEKIVLYFAEISSSDKVGEGGGVDEGEDVELVRVPASKAMGMLDRGELRDAKTQIALLRSDR